MKHRSLALAALALVAATAQAQSNVTLYGVVDIMAYRKELAGEVPVTRIDPSGLTTSFWGVRGVEDLGGGLKALFDLSSFIRVDTGGAARSDTDPYFSRSAWVGLGGGWGTVRLGRQTALGTVNLMRYSAFNDSSTFGPSFLHVYFPSAAQPIMTGAGASDSGWSNVLSYTSPDVAGFVAALHVAPAEATTAGRRTAGSLVYTGGAFSTGVTVDRLRGMSLSFSKPPAAVLMTDADTVNWGASYDLKVAKLFGQVIRTKLDNPTTEIKLTTASAGVTVPLGAGRILASYAQTHKTQTASADQKRKTFSLGYDYDLSKRTDLYAVLMNDRATGLSNGTGFGVGVRHRF
ncbi:MAG: porin Gram-negative type [Ramlibacter sp.]|nr:porin Gram-negative type [Ramlibacter sp.]